MNPYLHQIQQEDEQYKDDLKRLHTTDMSNEERESKLREAEERYRYAVFCITLQSLSCPIPPL